jgi:hypothetical protein
MAYDKALVMTSVMTTTSESSGMHTKRLMIDLKTYSEIQGNDNETRYQGTLSTSRSLRDLQEHRLKAKLQLEKYYSLSGNSVNIQTLQNFCRSRKFI